MPGGCESCRELRLLAAFPLSKPALPALPRGPGLAWGKKITEATQDQTQALNRVFFKHFRLCLLRCGRSKTASRVAAGLAGRGWARVSSVPAVGTGHSRERDTTRPGGTFLSLLCSATLGLHPQGARGQSW